MSLMGHRRKQRNLLCLDVSASSVAAGRCTEDACYKYQSAQSRKLSDPDPRKGVFLEKVSASTSKDEWYKPRLLKTV